MDTEETSAYETQPSVVAYPYSSFWPMLILLISLIGWVGYQAYLPATQAYNLRAEFQAGRPAIEAAQKSRARLLSLAQDLARTSANDPNAAQIAKDYNVPLNMDNGSGSGNSSNSGH